MTGNNPLVLVSMHPSLQLNTKSLNAPSTPNIPTDPDVKKGRGGGERGGGEEGAAGGGGGEAFPKSSFP